MGGVGGKKEGRERREEREGSGGEGTGGENNPVTLLLLRRSCLLFRMMKAPDMTTNCTKVTWWHGQCSCSGLQAGRRSAHSGLQAGRQAGRLSCSLW